MKIFTNKKFTQKLIIAILCVTLLNFCIAPASNAADFGGKMMGLMRSFATGIADVVASLVQFGVTGEFHWATAGKGSGKQSGGDEETAKYWIKETKFEYPILQVSPEVIFANQIELLDVNFISPVEGREYFLELKDDSALQTLRSIIAGWYVTLRTIAVVGLLSVLIYIGIRIMISSTSGDKAKYKERLVDWIVAFCLLFFMHYIMAAIVTVVDKVDLMLNEGVNLSAIPIPSEYGEVEYNESGIVEDVEDNDVGLGEVGLDVATVKNQIATLVKVKYNGGTYEVKGAMEEMGLVRFAQDQNNAITYETIPTQDGSLPRASFTVNLQTKSSNGTESVIGGNVYTTNSDVFDVSGMRQFLQNLQGPDVSDDGEGTTTITRPTGENFKISTEGDKVMYFINYARLFLNVKDSDKYIPMATAYLLIYIALVAFTAVFTVRYIKRVIYIAFLTLIAPVVALTYPLDKIKDRKSTSMEYVV